MLRRNAVSWIFLWKSQIKIQMFPFDWHKWSKGNLFYLLGILLYGRAWYQTFRSVARKIFRGGARGKSWEKIPSEKIIRVPLLSDRRRFRDPLRLRACRFYNITKCSLIGQDDSHTSAKRKLAVEVKCRFSYLMEKFIMSVFAKSTRKTIKGYEEVLAESFPRQSSSPQLLQTPKFGDNTPMKLARTLERN